MKGAFYFNGSGRQKARKGSAGYTLLTKFSKGMREMKVRVAVAEKVAWVRNHPVASLALSCSSFLLFLPRVQSLLIFFWPLLLSTALFVTALLTMGDSHKLEEESFDGDLDPVNAHVEENGHEEVGECSVSTQVHLLERQRSLIDYVVEQHEGAIVHFDSLFEESGGVLDQTLVLDPTLTLAAEDQKEEEDRRLRPEQQRQGVGSSELSET